MRKVMLLGWFVFVACDNDSARVAELEAALQECRAQTATPAAQADQPAPATAAVQPVTTTPSDQPTVALVNYAQSWNGVNNEFDWVNSDITDEHFTPEPGGTATVVLTPLNLHRDGGEWISTEEAQRRLATQGFRPATGRELRAFAKANPDYQRKFWVVALGSSWVVSFGGGRVPYLGGWRGRRALGLRWTGFGWASAWRFLAVRK